MNLEDEVHGSFLLFVNEHLARQQAADLLLDRAISLLLLLCSIVLSVLLLLQFLTESRTPLVSLIAEEDPQGYIVSTLEFQPTAHILAHLVDLSAGRYLMSTTFNLEVEPEIDLGGRVAEPIMREVRRALFPDAGALAAGPESRIGARGSPGEGRQHSGTG